MWAEVILFYYYYYSPSTQSYPLICVVKSMQALDSEKLKFRQLLISHWFSDQRKITVADPVRIGTDQMRWKYKPHDLDIDGFKLAAFTTSVKSWPSEPVPDGSWWTAVDESPSGGWKLAPCRTLHAAGERAKRISLGRTTEEGEKRSAVRTRAFRAPAMSSAITLEILH